MTASPVRNAPWGWSSMETRRVRLGDVIDDYCSRCRLLMNHGVVSIVGDEVKKVRCNTCMSEHAYRRGKLPTARRNATKKLFDEVLRGIAKPEHTVPGSALPRDSEPGEAAEPAPERVIDDDAGAGGERAAGPAGVADEVEEPTAGPEEAASGGAADDEGGSAPPVEHARIQRRLYTIRRSIGDKGSTRDPKKP